MSQTALITLLSILLFTGGIFGGGQKTKTPTRDPNPPIQAESESRGVVRANTVAVHEEPRSREVTAHLVRGDEVTILSETDGWYRVRIANGQTGYVNTFAISTATTSTPVKRSGKYEVVAYYLTDSRRPSMPSLTENVDLISTVVPWMWQISESGELIDDFDSRDVGRALTLAGTNKRKGVALVHNLQQTASGATTFDASLAHQILSSPRVRAKAVDNLSRKLKEWGMSGVHIDFEKVLPRDRQNLNLFMKELYERLHPEGLEVSIAVPSKTRDSISDSWSGGYDYATIARYSDKMMLMTYDEHWYGGEAGPVASIGWVERVVRYAISAGVPNEKIVLGVPGYGYDWPRHGRAKAVTYREAMATASQHGARILWEDTAKVPYFHYGAGRQVWFENRSSLSHKIDLVKEYGLRGISLWRLGQEDPGIWSVIRDNFS